MNICEFNQLKAQLRDWLSRLQPNYFLTFTFGYTVTSLAAKKPLDDFFNRVQRVSLGKHWNKLPADLRPVAIGFLEHKSTNAHYHILTKVDSKTATVLKVKGEAIWKGLVKRGQFHWAAIDNPGGAISYVTKELTEEAALDSIYVYSASVK